VCAVALIGDSSAISFDDLVARADEAAHPKKVEVERPDVEMEEWSTDHLLGLDTPPPSDMFDSLVNREPAEKTVVAHKKVMRTVKKAVKAAKTENKRVAPMVLHEDHEDHEDHEVAKVAKVAKKETRAEDHEDHEDHEDDDDEDDEESEQSFAQSLMSEIMDDKPRKQKTVVAHEKVSVKKAVKTVKSDDKHVAPKVDHEDEMITEDHKAPKVAKVAKAPKKETRREDESFSEVVPEDDEIEMPSIAGLPHAEHVAKGHSSHFDGLQGMATAMLERGDAESEAAKKAAVDKKEAEEKKDAAMTQLREAAKKASGGHSVELDLSGDEEEFDSAQDQEKDLPSLDSFMDDDDDDMDR